MTRDETIAELVLSNHILYDQGVVDGFGHVSVRDPADPHRFLLSRSKAPVLVAADDIRTFDFDGNPVGSGSEKHYHERFIHAGIYAARSDVHAVIHSHSPAIIPFSVSDVALRPIYHMSAFLGEGVPIFDIHDVAGDTDLLIGDMHLARLLVDALADKPVVLMRGHGSVAVGASLKMAVYRAVYTEMNAKLQSEATRLGGRVAFLTPGEAERAAGLTVSNLERPWSLWSLTAGAATSGR
jgi:ribulose-5-phosphate 4-epimerase/fuculose-1-phosphate aldolase